MCVFGAGCKHKNLVRLDVGTRDTVCLNFLLNYFLTVSQSTGVIRRTYILHGRVSFDKNTICKDDDYRLKTRVFINDVH